MLHPSQFQVNEAWIAFTLNDVPIATGSDGDFNFVTLMDAASCFILSSALVSATAAELSKMEAKRLLKEGEAHKQQLPKTLFIPRERPAGVLSAEAERRGITVVRLPMDELLPFVGEAKESFRERFGAGGKH